LFLVYRDVVSEDAIEVPAEQSTVPADIWKTAATEITELTRDRWIDEHTLARRNRTLSARDFENSDGLVTHDARKFSRDLAGDDAAVGSAQPRRLHSNESVSDAFSFGNRHVLYFCSAWFYEY